MRERVRKPSDSSAGPTPPSVAGTRSMSASCSRFKPPSIPAHPGPFDRYSERLANQDLARELDANRMPGAVSYSTAVAWALRGASGSPERIPHASAIERSFGPYSPLVRRAYLDECATRALGARGYTYDTKIVLAPNAGLDTVAHEAAHVIQQQAGLGPVTGLGRPGDQYEAMADAVASKVVRGLSAVKLLDAAVLGKTAAHRKALQLDPNRDEIEMRQPWYRWEFAEGESYMHADDPVQDDIAELQALGLPPEVLTLLAVAVGLRWGHGFVSRALVVALRAGKGDESRPLLDFELMQQLNPSAAILRPENLDFDAVRQHYRTDPSWDLEPGELQLLLDGVNRVLAAPPGAARIDVLPGTRWRESRHVLRLEVEFYERVVNWQLVHRSSRSADGMLDQADLAEMGLVQAPPVVHIAPPAIRPPPPSVAAGGTEPVRLSRFGAIRQPVDLSVEEAIRTLEDTGVLIRLEPSSSAGLGDPQGWNERLDRSQAGPAVALLRDLWTKTREAIEGLEGVEPFLAVEPNDPRDILPAFASAPTLAEIYVQGVRSTFSVRSARYMSTRPLAGLSRRALGQRAALWIRYLNAELRKIEAAIAENLGYTMPIDLENPHASVVNLSATGIDVCSNNGGLLGEWALQIDPVFAVAMTRFLEALRELGVTKLFTAGFSPSAQEPDRCSRGWSSMRYYRIRSRWRTVAPA